MFGRMKWHKKEGSNTFFLMFTLNYYPFGTSAVLENLPQFWGNVLK